LKDYHLDVEQKQNDACRTADLLNLGIKELRFTNNEVVHGLERVMEEISATLSNPPA
jgi:very-short-patch-repair endonuclease